jgi:hypothetical protein
MVKQLIAFVVFLSFALYANAATEVTASIDKNPVVVNESFVLTITANEELDANALDTSSLSKSFVVGRTNVQRQTSVINFSATRTTTWKTVLIARETGTYSIPSLTVDGTSTKPISIDVVSADDSRASSQQDIFITTDISKSSVYVQQLLTMTVKLHFATELKSGTLTEPELEDAQVNQIGKDVESQDIINGKRYRIIERTFSISPQKSGNFTLTPPAFSGEIMESSGRRGNFYSFANTKPVSVLSKPIDIEVKPIPVDYQGTWLPSELIALHQEWQPKDGQFYVGEPITSILTLTAAGLSKEQLPALEIEAPNGLRVYPDQPELNTGLTNGRLVSQQVKSFAIVASQPGTYQLPAIRIPWWNTVTNSKEWATINGQTITIKPNPNAPTETSIPKEESIETESANTKVTTIYVDKPSWLQWLFLGLWIASMVGWFFTYMAMRNKKPIESKYQQTSVDKSVILKACKQNNAQLVNQALLPWFNQHLDSPKTSLSQALTAINDKELTKAVEELQESLFGKQPVAWDSNALIKAIKGMNFPSNNTKQNRSSLHLNP